MNIFGLTRVLALTLLLCVIGSAQAASGKKPPTKVTEKLSQATYEQMSTAQEAMDAGDFAAAEAGLQPLVDRLEDLNLSLIHI